jgi:hypothetical protein
MILLEDGEISICETSNRLLAGSTIGFCTRDFTMQAGQFRVFADRYARCQAGI